MSWRWEPVILRRNAPSFPNMGRHSSWVPASCCVRQRMHLSSCPVCHILLSIGKNPLTGWPGQMGATTPGDTKCNQNPKMMQILGLVMLELCFLTSPLSHSQKKHVAKTNALVGTNSLLLPYSTFICNSQLFIQLAIPSWEFPEIALEKKLKSGMAFCNVESNGY